jgi:hypothetical protein
MLQCAHQESNEIQAQTEGGQEDSWLPSVSRRINPNERFAARAISRYNAVK